MQNIIKFGFSQRTDLVFCIVDRTNTILDGWTKEIIKNISDYTISNIVVKNFNVLQGINEDHLLRKATDDYKFAVVLSTGTEFINGYNFFLEIEKFLNQNFFIAGHVLDRGDAYYELHHQCYLINLDYYKKLNCPSIGNQMLGKKHTKIEPLRSQENFHDSHTPLWVLTGKKSHDYNHCCHGWNILSIAFNNHAPILIFNENLRKNKIYYYPESQEDFLKQSQWLYFRDRLCLQEFVHESNTEKTNKNIQGKFDQIVIPSSGLQYTDLISAQGKIVFYDYNQKSLDYYKAKYRNDKNETQFVKYDLLGEDRPIEDLLDTNIKNTFINLSNIFSYEGTCAFSSLRYRLYKENQIIQKLKEKLPSCTINFTARAGCAFEKIIRYGVAESIPFTDISTIKKPTWHINQDWI